MTWTLLEPTPAGAATSYACTRGQAYLDSGDPAIHIVVITHWFEGLTHVRQEDLALCGEGVAHRDSAPEPNPSAATCEPCRSEWDRRRDIPAALCDSPASLA